MSTELSVDTVQEIDRAIKTAFVYLEALDRRALAILTPPITAAQFHALAALGDEPGQTLGRLAQRLLCDKANASGLMDRLEVLGLAQRARDPQDGRRLTLRLTASGQEVLRQARAVRATELQQALAGAGIDRTATMTQHLTRLVGVLRAAYEGVPANSLEESS